MEMNLFDILILFVLGLGLVRGTVRGIIKELSSIMGVFLGFYIACRYYSVFALQLNPWINNYSYSSIISFLFIFMLSTLSVTFVSLFVNHIMNFNKTGWVSRACGGLFGLLEGGLVVAILLLVITTFFPQNIKFIKNSHLSPYLIQVSELLPVLLI